jgi:NAD(P)H-dependent FMN reductase
MTNFSIPLDLGDALTNRQSEHAARYVHTKLSERDGVEAPFVDVRDHPYQATTPPWGAGGADEQPTEWKQIAERADAFVFVIPEYNHGYAGEFKQLLDSVYEDYFKKPAALCGVSAGGFGGTRVVDHIKPVLVELGMTPVGSAMYFSRIKRAFDDDGNPTDPEGLEKPLAKMIDELLFYTKALKQNRESD